MPITNSTHKADIMRAIDNKSFTVKDFKEMLKTSQKDGKTKFKGYVRFVKSGNSVKLEKFGNKVNIAHALRTNVTANKNVLMRQAFAKALNAANWMKYVPQSTKNTIFSIVVKGEKKAEEGKERVIKDILKDKKYQYDETVLKCSMIGGKNTFTKDDKLPDSANGWSTDALSRLEVKDAIEEYESILNQENKRKAIMEDAIKSSISHDDRLSKDTFKQTRFKEKYLVPAFEKEFKIQLEGGTPAIKYSKMMEYLAGEKGIVDDGKVSESLFSLRITNLEKAIASAKTEFLFDDEFLGLFESLQINNLKSADGLVISDEFLNKIAGHLDTELSKQYPNVPRTTDSKGTIGGQNLTQIFVHKVLPNLIRKMLGEAMNQQRAGLNQDNQRLRDVFFEKLSIKGITKAAVKYYTDVSNPLQGGMNDIYNTLISEQDAQKEVFLNELKDLTQESAPKTEQVNQSEKINSEITDIVDEEAAKLTDELMEESRVGVMSFYEIAYKEFKSSVGGIAQDTFAELYAQKMAESIKSMDDKSTDADKVEITKDEFIKALKGKLEDRIKVIKAAARMQCGNTGKNGNAGVSTYKYISKVWKDVEDIVENKLKIGDDAAKKKCSATIMAHLMPTILKMKVDALMNGVPAEVDVQKAPDEHKAIQNLLQLVQKNLNKIVNKHQEACNKIKNKLDAAKEQAGDDKDFTAKVAILKENAERQFSAATLEGLSEFFEQAPTLVLKMENGKITGLKSDAETQFNKFIDAKLDAVSNDIADTAATILTDKFCTSMSKIKFTECIKKLGADKKGAYNTFLKTAQITTNKGKDNEQNHFFTLTDVNNSEMQISLEHALRNLHSSLVLKNYKKLDSDKTQADVQGKFVDKAQKVVANFMKYEASFLNALKLQIDKRVKDSISEDQSINDKVRGNFVLNLSKQVMAFLADGENGIKAALLKAAGKADKLPKVNQSVNEFITQISGRLTEQINGAYSDLRAKGIECLGASGLITKDAKNPKVDANGVMAMAEKLLNDQLDGILSKNKNLTKDEVLAVAAGRITRFVNERIRHAELLGIQENPADALENDLKDFLFNPNSSKTTIAGGEKSSSYDKLSLGNHLAKFAEFKTQYLKETEKADSCGQAWNLGPQFFTNLKQDELKRFAGWANMPRVDKTVDTYSSKIWKEVCRVGNITIEKANETLEITNLIMKSVGGRLDALVADISKRIDAQFKVDAELISAKLKNFSSKIRNIVMARLVNVVNEYKPQQLPAEEEEALISRNFLLVSVDINMLYNSIADELNKLATPKEMIKWVAAKKGIKAEAINDKAMEKIQGNLKKIVDDKGAALVNACEAVVNRCIAKYTDKDADVRSDDEIIAKFANGVITDTVVTIINGQQIQNKANETVEQIISNAFDAEVAKLIPGGDANKGVLAELRSEALLTVNKDLNKKIGASINDSKSGQVQAKEKVKDNAFNKLVRDSIVGAALVKLRDKLEHDPTFKEALQNGINKFFVDNKIPTEIKKPDNLDAVAEKYGIKKEIAQAFTKLQGYHKAMVAALNTKLTGDAIIKLFDDSKNTQGLGNLIAFMNKPEEKFTDIVVSLAEKSNSQWKTIFENCKILNSTITQLTQDSTDVEQIALETFYGNVCGFLGGANSKLPDWAFKADELTAKFKHAEPIITKGMLGIADWGDSHFDGSLVKKLVNNSSKAYFDSYAKGLKAMFNSIPEVTALSAMTKGKLEQTEVKFTTFAEVRGAARNEILEKAKIGTIMAKNKNTLFQNFVMAFLRDYEKMVIAAEQNLDNADDATKMQLKNEARKKSFEHAKVILRNLFNDKEPSTKDAADHYLWGCIQTEFKAEFKKEKESIAI